MTIGAPPAIRTAVYLHTPFCAIKCAYCNFASDVRGPGEGDLFFQGLEAEIAHHAAAGRLQGRVFDTLYVGGGTPTALDSAELTRLFEIVERGLALDPAAEITVEANPESLSVEKARLLRGLGANRISLGAQSFHDRELAQLNRPHDAPAIVRAVEAARRAGFDNLSLDLIYGLPGQTLERWMWSVERAVELAPEHLSAYCLILEPGTPLAGRVARGGEPAPDPDLQRAMFDWLVERADCAGLTIYELSNFARPGRRSEHNLRYWLGRPYLGLGPSAHGYLDRRRGANPARLDVWARHYAAASPPELYREVPGKDLVFERVFMALRLMDGLDLEAFESEFQAPLDAFYPGVVDRLEAAGWLARDARRLRLARHAWFVSDGVFCEFAPD